MGFSVVIPSRYAASRLPGKPLLDIAGKTLIQHVYECAQRSEAEQILIATDDDRIADAARGFGAKVCMTANNHPSGTDRLAEVVKQQGFDNDHVIVNLQGDEPLMPPTVINQVANNLMSRPEASMSTVCKRIKASRMLFDPHVVKVVSDEKGYALYFSRAAIPWDRELFPFDEEGDEELPEFFTHYAHIGLYAYRSGFLEDYVAWPVCHLEETESLEQLRVLYKGHKIHVEEAIDIPGPGVDTESDLLEVKTILASD